MSVVHVRLADGASLTVPHTASLSGFREALADATGVPPECQRLLVGGKDACSSPEIVVPGSVVDLVCLAPDLVEYVGEELKSYLAANLGDGRAAAVDVCLARGERPFYANSRQELEMACDVGNLKAVKALIEGGVLERSTRRLTLHMLALNAAYSGNAEIVEYLKTLRNATPKYSITSSAILECAVKRNHLDIVKLFAHEVDTRGIEAARRLVTRRGHADIVAYLESVGTTKKV